jgi:hyperosmotically inducible periplasmic protein
MAFNKSGHMTRRDFLRGEAPDSSWLGELDRENVRHEYWHPHQAGRSFDERVRISQGPDYSRRPEWHQDENGLFKGKGPRSYRRSDERILEDINDRLCDNPYIDASEVDVEVSNGEVTLTGSVNDRDSKWLAEDIGESVAGVNHVDNFLRVKKMGV